MTRAHRIESVLAALILVTATVLTTEWIHHRIGNETLWAIFRPDSKRPFRELEGDEGGFGSVTEADFERYLGVLERMQENHGLSIEEAVTSRELTLSRFRDIEQRVQRNDVLVERAREHLRKQAESLWDSRRAALAQG
jgi:hypothetical protein